MQFLGLMLGCVILGQTPATLSPPDGQTDPRPPQTYASPAESGSQFAAQRRGRLAAEIVADATRLPPDTAVAGQPLALLDAIKKAPADRRRQLEIVFAYWRLFEATAEYRCAFDHAALVDKTAAAADPELRAEHAAAAAEMRRMEVAAVRAQHDLAALILPPGDTALPLPADQPHVGAYRTSFKELFAGKTAPELARLADRMLPLMYQAIEQRAAAVQAAEDALKATSEQSRGISVSAIACSRDFFTQRRALIREVAAYNRLIAEYGFIIVPPSAGAETLLGMLIITAQPVGGESSGVAPIASRPLRRPLYGESSPAARSDGWRPNNSSGPSGDASRRPRNEPTLAPPLDHPPAHTPEIPDNPPQSDRGASVSPHPPERIALKPSSPLALREGPGVKASSSPLPLGEGPGVRAALSAAEPTPFLAALAAAAPSEKASRLALALHSEAELPAAVGAKPVALRDCLMIAGDGDRRATIAAYWETWRQAARLQSLSSVADDCRRLAALMLERRHEPSGAADMLLARAAETAASAAAAEARAALVEAQYVLALRLATVGDEAWPLAATAPHSGDYLLKLDAQPRGLRESWTVRSLSVAIPVLCENVRQRATAVIEADAARAHSAAQYHQGAVSAAEAIKTLNEQSRQTLALADVLAEYNLTIADYALAVLPPTTPADKLAEALVVKQ